MSLEYATLASHCYLLDGTDVMTFLTLGEQDALPTTSIASAVMADVATLRGCLLSSLAISSDEEALIISNLVEAEK